jgi:hypothetical protein
MNSCKLCSKGSFAEFNATVNCSRCAPGSIQDQEGESSCDLCPVGFYQDRSAQSECIRCDITHYSSKEGSSICSQCPNNTVSAYQGAESVLLCTCQQGYYGDAGQPCKTCPTGAKCLGGGTAPIAQAGYWKVNNDTFVACYPPEACLGGEDNTCSLGYRGGRCGDCAAPTYYRLGDYCKSTRYFLPKVDMF